MPYKGSTHYFVEGNTWDPCIFKISLNGLTNVPFLFINNFYYKLRPLLYGTVKSSSLNFLKKKKKSISVFVE